MKLKFHKDKIHAWRLDEKQYKNVKNCVKLKILFLKAFKTKYY